MPWYMHGCQRRTCGVGFVIPCLCRFWGLNSGLQDCLANNLCPLSHLAQQDAHWVSVCRSCQSKTLDHADLELTAASFLFLPTASVVLGMHSHAHTKIQCEPFFFTRAWALGSVQKTGVKGTLGCFCQDHSGKLVISNQIQGTYLFEIKIKECMCTRLQIWLVRQSQYNFSEVIFLLALVPKSNSCLSSTFPC